MNHIKTHGECMGLLCTAILLLVDRHVSHWCSAIDFVIYTWNKLWFPLSNPVIRMDFVRKMLWHGIYSKIIIMEYNIKLLGGVTFLRLVLLASSPCLIVIISSATRRGSVWWMINELRVFGVRWNWKVAQSIWFTSYIIFLIALT